MGAIVFPRESTRQPRSEGVLIDALSQLDTRVYVAGTGIYPASNVQVVGADGAMGARATSSSGNVDVGKVIHPKVGGLTLMAQVAIGSGATDKGYMSGNVGYGGGYIEDFAFDCNQSESFSLGRVMLMLRNPVNGSQVRASTTGSVGVAGETVTVVARMVDATTLDIWANGVEQSIVYGATGTYTANTDLSDFPITVFARNNRGSTISALQKHQLLMWARIPSTDFGISPGRLSHNPWQIFKRRALIIPTSEAVATTPTLSNLAASDLTATGARLSVDLTF